MLIVLAERVAPKALHCDAVVVKDQLAAAIRAEIAAELVWEARLSASPGELSALADEALAEHRSGHTRPLDPDEQ